ncbi:MAG: 4-hydroxy-tetrahydrodipicolinate synthase [Acidimicrobiia bacterium]
MSELRLQGVYVPLITPFAVDGSVDIKALVGLSNRYLDAGVAGLVPLGTTGESAGLDVDEKRAVVEAVGQVCSERKVPMIVGAGTNSTHTTVAAVQALKDAPGLAAVLIVVPYYVRPSELGIVKHFETVASASPVPVVMYNIATRTGKHLPASHVLAAAEHPNIKGIKQASTGLDVDTLQLLAGAPEEFAVLGGEDPFLFPLTLMGGRGAIAATAHVCTARFVSMIEHGLAGRVEQGRADAEALLPVVQACFAEPNPAVFKGVLHAQGLIASADVRAPLMNASHGAISAALSAIDAATP